MSILEDISTSIPRPSTGIACLSLILNIIIPGLGTIVAAIAAGSPARQIIVGILQFPIISAFFGYFWAIYWSCRMIEYAKNSINPDKIPKDTSKTYDKDNSKNI